MGTAGALGCGHYFPHVSGADGVRPRQSGYSRVPCALSGASGSRRLSERETDSIGESRLSARQDWSAITPLALPMRMLPGASSGRDCGARPGALSFRQRRVACTRGPRSRPDCIPPPSGSTARPCRGRPSPRFKVKPWSSPEGLFVQNLGGSRFLFRLPLARLLSPFSVVLALPNTALGPVPQVHHVPTAAVRCPFPRDGGSTCLGRF